MSIYGQSTGVIITRESTALIYCDVSVSSRQGIISYPDSLYVLPLEFCYPEAVVFCSSNLVVVNIDAMMIQSVVGFVISLYTFKSFCVLSVGIATRYGLDDQGIEYR